MIRRRSERALALSLVFTSLSAAFTLAATPKHAHAQPRRGAAEPPRPRLTKAPALVEFVEADYPPDALAAGTSATVVLQIAISASGTVDDAAVVDSAGPEFDAAALAAARRFVFSPAEIDGVPAPVKITYRYEFVPRVVAKTTGAFRGVVVAKGSAEKLAGVTVELEGVGSAVTDAEGAFQFDDVPPGELSMTLSGPNLTRVQTRETFEAGRVVEARYTVELPPPPGSGDADEEQDDLEVVVVAPRILKQVVSTEVSADEARRVPGTQGDVLKVVENLPGVARSTAGSGQLVVWGAAPQDTRTYVGAVRIPMLYHFGGLRSVIHNDRVASVELVPGGYGAGFGRGLGGLVRVTWREPEKERLRGSVQADVLDAAAAVSGPLSERLRFAISGRRSHVAQASELLSDQSFQEFFTLPNYHDGQARLRYDVAPGEYVELGGLLSGDRQSRTQPSDDPARRVSETRTLSFERYDVAYRKQLASGAEVDVAPWYGRDRMARRGDFGGIPTFVDTDSHLVGFRSEWRGRLSQTWTAHVGFEVEVVQSTSRRSGSITAPPREGDAFIFGRAPADQVNDDIWKTTIASAAPYAEGDWALFGEKLHLTPGVRLEPFFLNVNRRKPAEPNAPDLGAYVQDVSVQPRLATRYAVTDDVTVKAAYGLYRQPPLPDDLSAVFGNPTLGVSRGTHYVGGVQVRLADKLSGETNVFHTNSEALVARNPAESPRIGQALIQEGRGRSIGAQLLLRRDKGDGRVFGWVAYTILRSERQDSPGQAFRLFDFDQTHVLTALLSYDLGKGFEVGARVRFASGFPRTPIRFVYFDGKRNRYEPTLGDYNSDRIPYFAQVDVRASKRVAIAKTELEIYLDVQNVTNRQNPEEIAYSPDFSSRRYVRGLPVLPVLGARWSF
jgi:TonB family protein